MRVPISSLDEAAKRIARGLFEQALRSPPAGSKGVPPSADAVRLSFRNGRRAELMADSAATAALQAEAEIEARELAEVVAAREEKRQRRAVYGGERRDSLRALLRGFSPCAYDPG